MKWGGGFAYARYLKKKAGKRARDGFFKLNSLYPAYQV
jgi:hypothetical protein